MDLQSGRYSHGRRGFATYTQRDRKCPGLRRFMCVMHRHTTAANPADMVAPAHQAVRLAAPLSSAVPATPAVINPAANLNTEDAGAAASQGSAAVQPLFANTKGASAAVPAGGITAFSAPAAVELRTAGAPIATAPRSKWERVRRRDADSGDDMDNSRMQRQVL